MATINHFESETPCYRVAHDGEQVVSVTFASGMTSSKHQIITGDSWADVVEKLGEQAIATGDAFVPEPEPEPDIN